MNGGPSDQSLIEIVGASTPATIDDVIDVMQNHTKTYGELPPVHERSIAVMDRVTGLAGRGLLVPIQ